MSEVLFIAETQPSLVILSNSMMMDTNTLSKFITLFVQIPPLSKHSLARNTSSYTLSRFYGSWHLNNLPLKKLMPRMENRNMKRNATMITFVRAGMDLVRQSSIKAKPSKRLMTLKGRNALNARMALNAAMLSPPLSVPDILVYMSITDTTTMKKSRMFDI